MQALYAKINIARKEQGLDEETYRAFLENITGKDSLKKMTTKELKAVVDAFIAKGFSIKKRGKPTVAAHLKSYIDKIEALLAELGRVRGAFVSWDYAGTILTQMYNLPNFQKATWSELQGVIVALKKQLEKEEITTTI